MIASNELLYSMNKLIGSDNKFMGANDFSKYVNNKLSIISTMTWIKTANSKAVKQAMLNCEKAFKKFFKKQSDFPKYKKKKDFYGVYLPLNSEITSCTITKIADKYFVSILVKEEVKICNPKKVMVLVLIWE